jgi:hypothetical protein
MVRHPVFVVLASCLLLTNAVASEWYEDAAWMNSDPFEFSAQQRILFPRTGLILNGHPTSTKRYATLKRAVVESIEKSPNHLVVMESHKLTAQEARSYKKIFRDEAGRGQVPWIVGAIGSVPVRVTAAFGIASTLLDGLMRIGQNQTVSADGLSELMTEGGSFDLAFIILHDPAVMDHRYICSSISYSTTVGKEARSYVIKSATFPLQVVD